MTAGRGAGEVAGGFAQGAGGRWTYAGALTCANAGAVFAASGALPLPASGEVDLAGIGAVDSATVAVLLALTRRARTEGRTIAFVNVPQAIDALAKLYGVGEIIAP